MYLHLDYTCSVSLSTHSDVGVLYREATYMSTAPYQLSRLTFHGMSQRQPSMKIFHKSDERQLTDLPVQSSAMLATAGRYMRPFTG